MTNAPAASVSAATIPAAKPRRPIRWHIGVLLAPATIVYTIVMIIPLIETPAHVAVHQGGRDGRGLRRARPIT